MLSIHAIISHYSGSNLNNILTIKTNPHHPDTWVIVLLYTILCIRTLKNIASWPSDLNHKRMAKILVFRSVYSLHPIHPPLWASSCQVLEAAGVRVWWQGVGRYQRMPCQPLSDGRHSHCSRLHPGGAPDEPLYVYSRVPWPNMGICFCLVGWIGIRINEVKCIYILMIHSSTLRIW